jgi:hypothetical protein
LCTAVRNNSRDARGPQNKIVNICVWNGYGSFKGLHNGCLNGFRNRVACPIN